MTTLRSRERHDTRRSADVYIADPSDLILTVATRSKTTYLHVSSFVMSSASPAFSRMLARATAPSQALRDVREHQSVSIYDEHPDDVLLLCRMLHFNKKLSRQLDVHNSESYQLLRVAVLAAKYLCIQAIRYTLEAILDRRAYQTSHVDCKDYHLSGSRNMDLAAAASVLQYSRYFWLCTRRVVLDSTLSIQDLRACESGKVLPMPALERIVSQRAEIIEVLELEFFELIYRAAGSGELSGGFGKPLPMTAEAIDKLHLARSTWPLEFRRTSTSRSILHAFHNHGDLEISVSICTLETTKKIGASDLRAMAKVLSLQATGVCVRCVDARPEACNCSYASSNVERLAALDPISDWMERD